MSLGWFNLCFKRCYVFNIACIIRQVYTENPLSEMVYILAWIDFHMLLEKIVKSHDFRNESSLLKDPVTFLLESLAVCLLWNYSGSNYV